jgi:cytochrome c peroxidase
MNRRFIVIISILVMLSACYKDNNDAAFQATPFELNIPKGLPPMVIPADNPLTVEGVYLGRMLFYDPILSGDNSQSCASCHMQQHGFTDGQKYSVGIDGIEGIRNAMPLINLGWQSTFFWDGGATDLESQALGPVVNPIEMHETWANAVNEIKAIPMYQTQCLAF